MITAQVLVRLQNGTKEPISPQYFGDSDWSPVILDLSKYANSTIQIEFYFSSDCGGIGPGWFVDDVQMLPPVSNTSPTFAAVPAQVVGAGAALTFRVVASDSGAGQTITYSLDTNSAPVGASIDSKTGNFSWTPSADQVQINGYYITIRATDNGQPSLTSSLVIPIITTTGLHLSADRQDGGLFHIGIPDALFGFDYVLEQSGDFRNWQPALAFSPRARGEPQCYQSLIGATSAHLFYRLKATPTPVNP
jgi:hypothetical protein